MLFCLNIHFFIGMCRYRDCEESKLEAKGDKKEVWAIERNKEGASVKFIYIALLIDTEISRELLEEKGYENNWEFFNNIKK
ncbi:hypothetical protein CN428_24455 [Bacillus cereus]|nr:hypothetical protein CN428_24455 [Bacillus cereus]